MSSEQPVYIRASPLPLAVEALLSVVFPLSQPFRMKPRLFVLGSFTTPLLLVLLSSLSAVVAPDPFHVAVEKFQWPPEAVVLLDKHLNPHFNQKYTEEQADSFLAEGLLHLTEQSAKLRESTAGVIGSKRFENILRYLNVLPSHRNKVDGVEHSLLAGRHTPRWMSLPLLEPGSADHRIKHLYHVHLPNNKVVRSLDMIRLDKFQVKKHDGFWLPTAIVRPYRSSKALRFKVVYEYPTSANKYRMLHERNPELAAGSLRQALNLKQDTWTAKLGPFERRLVTDMWAKAPGSPLIDTSPLVRQRGGENSFWKRPSNLDRAGSSAAASSRVNQQREAIDDTSESETGSGGSFSDGSEREGMSSAPPNVLESHPAYTIEHNSLGARGQMSANVVRPQPRYPIPQWPLHQQELVHSGNLESGSRSFDTQHEVNLDLSLAPPASRGKYS